MPLNPDEAKEEEERKALEADPDREKIGQWSARSMAQPPQSPTPDRSMAQPPQSQPTDRVQYKPTSMCGPIGTAGPLGELAPLGL